MQEHGYLRLSNKIHLARNPVYTSVLRALKLLNVTTCYLDRFTLNTTTQASTLFYLHRMFKMVRQLYTTIEDEMQVEVV